MSSGQKIMASGIAKNLVTNQLEGCKVVNLQIIAVAYVMKWATWAVFLDKPTAALVAR